MGKLKAAAMLFCTNPYSLAPRLVPPRSFLCYRRPGAGLWAGRRYRSLFGALDSFASVTRAWSRIIDDCRHGGPIGKYGDIFSGRALCESA